ncbi:MAG: ABC transporter permease [Candidatus Omnitrophica bacterium]|nr:ABC transporter permease [Candidatus Omnitrophota bacterium]
MIAKIWAFIRKDILTETSYRLSFCLNILGVFMSVLVYFFIDKLFGSRVVGHLEPFGVNYFSYVLLGMAFFSYIGVGLGSFSERIRTEQVQGTLEALLVTPASLPVIVFSLALGNLVMATIDAAIYILMGIYVFGIDFSKVNLLSCGLVLILTFLSFSGLGIISASFIIVFKRGNPTGWVINNLQGLISGVYFPVTVLPAWLQAVSRCLPITYAIRAIQLAVYRGAGPSAIATELCMLALFSLLLIPLSFLCFGFAIRYAKRQGSLSYY